MTGAEFVYDHADVPHRGRPRLRPRFARQQQRLDSDFTVGVSGWYHLARGNNADFSIGGGAGLFYTVTAGQEFVRPRFALEPGAEARVFLTPNFALTGRVGIAITFGDNNSDTTLSIAGQETAAFGFTYFFR